MAGGNKNMFGGNTVFEEMLAESGIGEPGGPARPTASVPRAPSAGATGARTGEAGSWQLNVLVDRRLAKALSLRKAFPKGEADKTFRSIAGAALAAYLSEELETVDSMEAGHGRA